MSQSSQDDFSDIPDEWIMPSAPITPEVPESPAAELPYRASSKHESSSSRKKATWFNNTPYSRDIEKPAKYIRSSKAIQKRRSNLVPSAPTSMDAYRLETTMPPSYSFFGTYIPSLDVHNAFCETGIAPPDHFATNLHSDVEFLTGKWECGFSSDKAGRLHFQFFAKFRTQQRIGSARHKLHHFIPQYLEPARTDEGSIKYVEKAETGVGPIYRHGIPPPGKGQPKGGDALTDFLMAGASLYDVLESDHKYAYSRKTKYFNSIIEIYERPRLLLEEPFVAIYWGVTGAGKSTAANGEYPKAYRKTVPGKWYEGYKGEKCVIYEDYNPLCKEELDFPLHSLLTHLDRFGCKIEKKGTSCQLQADTFIFTSNIDPRIWFAGHPQQAAFCRRIKCIREYHTPFSKLKPGENAYFEASGMIL